MKRKNIRRAAAAAALLLAAAVLACAIYVNTYYHSDAEAESRLLGTEEVSVTQLKQGIFLDGSGEECAMIFYPGAKVEYTAYLPMLTELAGQGIDCFLMKMPCNLAFLGSNRADEILETYEYDDWYIGGHSLGGAMAASYASAHLEQLRGLALFAAYPTSSLAAEDFSVVSVYGSEDQVLNMTKVEQGRQWMPEKYMEVCIEGGNHAQFGNYGAQKGDGEPLISAQEQQKQAVEAVLEMIKNGRE